MALESELRFDSIEEHVAMRKRHLEIALRMQAVALYALEELERKVAGGEPLGLSAEDAKILLDAGEKLEREGVGGKERDDGAPIPPPKPN